MAARITKSYRGVCGLSGSSMDASVTKSVPFPLRKKVATGDRRHGHKPCFFFTCSISSVREDQRV
jgi:hypothetical protein